MKGEAVNRFSDPGSPPDPAALKRAALEIEEAADANNFYTVAHAVLLVGAGIVHELSLMRRELEQLRGTLNRR